MMDVVCVRLINPRLAVLQEKIVYKDVPVPVHMSNERVIVKEVPGEFVDTVPIEV